MVRQRVHLPLEDWASSPLVPPIVKRFFLILSLSLILLFPSRIELGSSV
jgi:hypothetical protein